MVNKTIRNNMTPKTIYDYILIRPTENPFLRKVTTSGILLASNLVESAETGTLEKLDQRIGFGIVEGVGPECKYLSKGDGVFYDKSTLRPIPSQIVLWQSSERTIMSYYTKDELVEAFDIYEKEQKEYDEQLKINRQNLEQEATRNREANAKQREADIASGKVKPIVHSPLIKIK